MTFFLKISRWIWVLFVLLVFGGGFFVWRLHADKGPYYETQLVERGDVRRTVEVTGTIKPATTTVLSFKISGKLLALSTKVGGTVKKGEALAFLDASDLTFALRRAEVALSVARANLQLRQAGETRESIRLTEVAVEQAELAYQKALRDIESTKQTGEDEYQLAVIAEDQAKRNLENTMTEADQAVRRSYETQRNILQTALGAMQIGLADGDSVIGIDDVAGNDVYESTLGVGDRFSLELAKQTYVTIKPLKQQTESAVRVLSGQSALAEIKIMSEQMRNLLQKTQTYLDYVQKTLVGTIPSVYVSATEIAAKKMQVETDRAALSAQLTSVINGMQALESSEQMRVTKKSQAEHAIEIARRNLETADHSRTIRVNAAQDAVRIQAAAVQSARAALAMKKSPVRLVDIASLTAAVRDAEVAYVQARERLGDAQLIAPADGVVTEVVPTVGELVLAQTKVLSIISARAFHIEALVPEADIDEVEVGQSASQTLDAYGETVKFLGTVLSEDPWQTKMQDVVYYKVTIVMDPTDHDVKAGLSANVSILTGEKKNALFISLRAIREQDTRRFVRVIEDRKAREAEVVVGLHGDEGRTEIVSGLQEGQRVVIGELTKKEYEASRP